MTETTAIAGDNGADTPRAKPLSVLAKGIDRLEAIARGEHIEAVVHKKVYDEQPVLEIEKFSLWYGHKQALFDVTMPIPKGRVTAIIGPSGCGKTTLLRCVNRMNDLIEGVRTEGDMRVHTDWLLTPERAAIHLPNARSSIYAGRGFGAVAEPAGAGANLAAVSSDPLVEVE